MHIKQVIIRGFKTYKDQVSLAEDFHPGVNVVVGFNGSGKSNFFNAILFVISDHYGSLRQETRKALLHEGTGPAVLTAFVEIIFDNVDRRMPIDRDDVRIRRTIGVKKDDYSLDGKLATKAEVFNLLESCGFTKSNPYYIVQQGKVSELTLMNDAKRLELIKEISGASVYDERRAESEKLLDEVRQRQEKTNGIIEMVATRIKSLEEEQKELVEYQQLEKQRRCLEYELTDRDWRTAQDRVDSLESERKDAAVQLHEAQREAAELRQRLTDAETEVQQASVQKHRLAVERDEAERLRSGRLEELTRLRLELGDEARRSEEGKKARSEQQAEVKRLQEEARSLALDLEAKKQPLAKELERRRDLAQRRQICETRRSQLLAQQGRGGQYASVPERNKALGLEITRRKARKEKAATQLKECDAELKRLERTAQAASQVAMAKRRDMKLLEQQLHREVAPELQAAAEQLERCAEQRRLLMQDRERIAREREEADRQAQQCQSRIESTMPRPQRAALSEVRRWVDRMGLQESVYGTLLEAIQVPPAFCIATESTAGSALFNLLVKDDDIAGQIVSFVRKGSHGSIVCTPLNQLATKARQYPKIDGVTPLVDKIICPPWAAPAVHQVFGRTVVCKTLELCDEVSRKHGLDAITMDGDKVSSRGTMTGGYQDPSRFVRLSLSEKMRQAKEGSQLLGPKLEEVEEQARDLSSQLEDLHGKRRALQDTRGQRRGELAQATEAAQEAESQVARTEEASRRLEERADEMRSQIAENDAAIQAMDAEMKTKGLGDFTEEEQQNLQRLSEDLRDLESQLASCEEQCHQMHRVIKGQEQHLQEFVKRRLNELESDLIRDSQADQEEHYLERSKALARVEREQQEASQGLERLGNQLAELEVTLGERRKEHEKLQNEDQKLQRHITQRSGQLDDIVLKINGHAKKKAEAEEKLRSFTIVSSDMGKYQGMSATQLMQELSKTNKALGKFKHVNKKAIDQFTTFTDQLSELERKREEMDESLAAVTGFIKQVDEQKDQILAQTLQRVDQHFREIFSELVRGGAAKLQMLRPGNGDDVDAAGGIRIEVSFSGQSTSFLTMAQLSGGQKTVVAIALVFAMQRLEPAPFYLFDEIDAALDTQHRTAIARLIARDAKNAQMVITTFRPEIIETADRFYRVYQKNRVSRIECVPRQEARLVIEEQTRLENIDD